MMENREKTHGHLNDLELMDQIKAITVAMETANSDSMDWLRNERSEMTVELQARVWIDPRVEEANRKADAIMEWWMNG